MIRRSLTILLYLGLLLPAKLHAQELNATVRVVDDRVSADKRIFRDMERNFREFLNNQVWTEDEFKTEERINCEFVITIDEASTGNYKATVAVRSSRPVYNSSYQTLMFTFADREWQYQYQESQPINFNENNITSNLAALLGYYAYIILGMDYDSFSELGGTPYFEKAWNIVNLMQQQGYGGWEQFESNRNRYWLAENLVNAQFEALRKTSYQYHLQGLDTFWEDQDNARSVISESLKGVEEAHKVRPNTIFTITFMDAKVGEIVNIFSQGDMTVRRDVYNMLTKVAPAKRDELDGIIKN